MYARAMLAPLKDRDPARYPERRSMRKLGFFLFVAAAACSKEPLPRAANGAPVLEIRGALKGGPHALGRADLDKLPRLSVDGVDPRSGQAARWEGISIAKILNDRLELRHGADTVVFRTADGTAIPVPLGAIRQLRPVLADRADGVRIATGVVAWPTAEQAGLATDPRAVSWWARDLVALEIVDWQRTYGPALAPPEDARDDARRGAGVYAESCISCHRVRGAGGQRGPDLSTVASRIHAESFVALLPTHPGWKERRVRDGGEQASADVWAFLRSIAPLQAAAAADVPAERPIPENAVSGRP
jgi:mono/diheme cytochrome c family protein